MTRRRMIAMRHADQAAGGGAWPYDTPIYTGIPPIFSAMGAIPHSAPHHVRHLVGQYEQAVAIDHDLHAQAGREHREAHREAIHEKRRDIRKHFEALEHKINALGWRRGRGPNREHWHLAR